MAFFMTLFVFFRTLSCRVTEEFPDASSHYEQTIQEFSFDPITKEEFRLPSPTPQFTEADILSSVLKRLGELEEKVLSTLQEKPSEMPHDKEELLNAAICRVDALEAELIATKKALHEADSREESKCRREVLLVIFVKTRSVREAISDI